MDAKSVRKTLKTFDLMYIIIKVQNENLLEPKIQFFGVMSANF